MSPIRIGAPEESTVDTPAPSSVVPMRATGTRAFAEASRVGALILEVLDGLASGSNDNSAVEASVRRHVRALCDRFPIYPHQ